MIGVMRHVALKEEAPTGDPMCTGMTFRLEVGTSSFWIESQRLRFIPLVKHIFFPPADDLNNTSSRPQNPNVKMPSPGRTERIKTLEGQVTKYQEEVKQRIAQVGHKYQEEVKQRIAQVSSSFECHNEERRKESN